MAFSQGHALVIGVGSYQYESWLDIPISVREATQVQSLLINPRYCGYPQDQVAWLYDDKATRQGVLSALDDLAGRTGPGDTAVLFYCGHGDTGEDGEYYLTTHDTRLSNRRIAEGAGVSQAELLQRVSQIRAERFLLVFNACHSGDIAPQAFGTDDETPDSPVPEDTVNALLGAGQGRIIITACREDQKSYFRRTDDLSFFTKALTNGLRGTGVQNRGGVISVYDLYNYLYQAVKDEAQTVFGTVQEPTLAVTRGVGPFAVALYRGATSLGVFDESQPAPNTPAARAVPEHVSREAFQRITQTNTVTAGERGVAVGRDITGSTIITGNRNQVGSRIDTGGGAFIGGRVNTGGGTFVGRDQVTHGDQVQGDKVQGDKVRGSKVEGDQIRAGDVSGTGIAIGRGAQAQVNQSPSSGSDLGQWFQSIYRQIDRRLDDPAVDKDEIAEVVQKIQAEVAKGLAANPEKIGRWLRNLGDIAPDIRVATASVLANPAAGTSPVIQQLARHGCVNG